MVILSPDPGNIDSVSRWRTEPFHGRPYVTSLQQQQKNPRMGEKERKENTTLNTPDSTFGQRNLCQSFSLCQYITYNLFQKRIQNRINSRLILYSEYLKLFALQVRYKCETTLWVLDNVIIESILQIIFSTNFFSSKYQPPQKKIKRK